MKHGINRRLKKQETLWLFSELNLQTRNSVFQLWLSAPSKHSVFKHLLSRGKYTLKHFLPYEGFLQHRVVSLDRFSCLLDDQTENLIKIYSVLSFLIEENKSFEAVAMMLKEINEIRFCQF